MFDILAKAKQNYYQLPVMNVLSTMSFSHTPCDNETFLRKLLAMGGELRNIFINPCLTACRELRKVRINPFAKAWSEQRNPDRNMHLRCLHEVAKSLFEVKSIRFVAQLSLV